MSLIGYWPLNSNTYDISGYGKHAIESLDISYEDGAIRQSVRTTGIDANTSRVRFPQTLFPGVTSSFALWVKPNEILGRFAGRIYGSSGGSRSGSFIGGLTLTPQRFMYYLRQSDTVGVTITDPNQYVIGNWYHLVAVVDADNLVVKLYVNGVLVGQDVFDGTTSTGVASMDIGWSMDSNNTYYDCNFEDVRIYDHALSEAEISEIYNTRPRINNNGDVEAVTLDEQGFSTSGLVGYYPLAGDAADYSGNNVNGTIVGATDTDDMFSRASHALNFAGGTTPQYVSVANTKINTMHTGAISMWIYPQGSGTPDGGGTIAFFNSGLDGRTRLFYHNNDYITFVKGNPSRSASNFSISLGNWYKVVVTWDAASTLAQFFVNGVQVGSDFTYFDTTSNAGTSYIGTFSGSSPQPGSFNGKISDVLFYSRVLTQAEITDSYNHDLGRFRIDNTGTIDAIEFIEDSALSPQARYKKESLTAKGEIKEI